LKIYLGFLGVCVCVKASPSTEKKFKLIRKYQAYISAQTIALKYPDWFNLIFLIQILIHFDFWINCSTKCFQKPKGYIQSSFKQRHYWQSCLFCWKIYRNNKCLVGKYIFTNLKKKLYIIWSKTNNLYLVLLHKSIS